jgi:4-hydroxy-tetrahydrodipicolinate reductase
MPRTATDSEGAGNIPAETKIGVLGCTGRVGSLAVREIQARHFGPGVTLAGGTVRPGIPAKHDFFTTSEPDELFKRADALIDFTAPEATAKHAWLAAKHRKPLIIGTTGLNVAQESELRDAAKETPIVYAANMSLGVNFLLVFIEQMASRLGSEWDIEILETHHKYKLDSPSGTALALGKAAVKGRGGKEDFVHDRSGERTPGSIGFAVRRGGDTVGDHTVSFMTEGEIIELRHVAGDRVLFARGAVKAALWLKDRPPGLYSMRDVLGL